jgi:hypothetical protein
LAIQLRRDVKPTLDANGVKLIAVSIGTVDRAKEFVRETEFPIECLYADPENKCYDALRRVLLALDSIRPRWRCARRSLRTLSPGARFYPLTLRFRSPPATPFNSIPDAFQLHPDATLRLNKSLKNFSQKSTPEMLQARWKKDGAKDLREVFSHWKPWIPPKREQGFQQGGVFAFEGDECVYQFYDPSTGVHAPFGDWLVTLGVGPLESAPEPVPRPEKNKNDA